MISIPVLFIDKMVAISGSEVSPSAHKPALMAKYLKDHPSDEFEVSFLDPVPLETKDFLRCHSEPYVSGVLSMTRPNGFGTYSRQVVDSLPWTSGAMHTAARLARADLPVCALASGFHHAGWEGQSYGTFCTFNGLMVTACKLLEEGECKKVAIVDCDMHWGDGTDDILRRRPELRDSIFHYTFGLHFAHPRQAPAYLARFGLLQDELKAFNPDVIIYQSGADVHTDDPCAGRFGGVLTTEQMLERDVKMFTIARDLQIPIAWCLAGGYQVAPDGSIDKVLELHYNTFKACAQVYGA